MIEVEARLRRWGRSFGIVIPMEVIMKERLREDEKIKVLVRKEESPIRKTFGTVKFDRPIKEILDEGDRESWDE